jgi:hypothetical protein
MWPAGLIASKVSDVDYSFIEQRSPGGLTKIRCADDDAQGPSRGAAGLKRRNLTTKSAKDTKVGEESC